MFRLCPLAAVLIASTHGLSAQTVAASSTTWKTVVPQTLRDQKTIYADFPAELARGKHWIPVAAFLAGNGALIAVDQYDSPYFRRSTTYGSLNTGMSGSNTSLLIIGIPAATYVTSLIAKNSYGQSTALLAVEAVVDSEITAELLKMITRRARPESIAPRGNFADFWGDSRTLTDGGFPSGHTISAFSVATIMSQRYGRNHRWVPYVSYGMAGAIGFSRMTLSAHNASDAVAGAAHGYVISRFVVIGHHH